MKLAHCTVAARSSGPVQQTMGGRLSTAAMPSHQTTLWSRWQVAKPGWLLLDWLKPLQIGPPDDSEYDHFRTRLILQQLFESLFLKVTRFAVNMPDLSSSSSNALQKSMHAKVCPRTAAILFNMQSVVTRLQRNVTKGKEHVTAVHFYLLLS